MQSSTSLLEPAIYVPSRAPSQGESEQLHIDMSISEIDYLCDEFGPDTLRDWIADWESRQSHDRKTAKLDDAFFRWNSMTAGDPMRDDFF